MKKKTIINFRVKIRMIKKQKENNWKKKLVLSEGQQN
jgi:hypothetical protein